MSPSSTIVYVSCAESKEIHCFRQNAENGALEPLQIVPVPGTGEPSPSNMPLAFGPGRRTLYTALRTPPFPVSAFSIDRASGTLMCLGTAPLPAPMAYIAVGGGGRVLMGASYVAGKLSVNRIGPDATVQAPPSQVVTTPPKAHCIVSGRSDDVVYATTLEGNAILIFQLDAGRAELVPADTPSVPCRPGSGPRHLVMHPSRDVLYCVNETSGTLAAFAVEPGTGALRELQYETLLQADFRGNARAADVHITPDANFIYASVRSTDAIAGFRIDARSGLLSPIGRFAVEGSPRGFAIDPSGRFLICAGQTEHTIGVYGIDQDSGALTRRWRIGAGANPNWVETATL
ncbi:MAG TPA: lactonase family protein [Xanthobacteraceae bacterium]|nr:lactonase family protein [Xanthobacteraceae bacterium]